MSELECVLSFCLCCFHCEDCLKDSYVPINENKDNFKDNEDEDDLNNIKVLFIYNQSEDKIDKNIHKIIFYNEYFRGYYDEYKIDIDKKQILLIYNTRDIKNISDIINGIHKTKGLLLNNKKWIPKYIWVSN